MLYQIVGFPDFELQRDYLQAPGNCKSIPDARIAMTVKIAIIENPGS
jgi:hypothetical protein